MSQPSPDRNGVLESPLQELTSDSRHPQERTSMITPLATPTGTVVEAQAPFSSDVTYEDITGFADDATITMDSTTENPITESMLEPDEPTSKEQDMGGSKEGKHGDKDDDEEEEEEEEEEATKEKKAAQLVTDYGKYLHEMENRVVNLEKKIIESESDDEDLVARKKSKASKRGPIIPKLRRIEWREFKNRHIDDKDVYAIDVLVSGAEFYYQRRKDKSRRKQRLDALQGPNNKDLGLEMEQKLRHVEIPERIRINSPALLTILAEIAFGDASNAEKESLVFVRPYKTLTRYFDEIKQHYAYLEKKWAEGEDDKKSLNETVPQSNAQHEENQSESESLLPKEEPKKTPEDLADSLEAFRDLRCLIEFMDDELQPLIDQTNDITNTKIRFHDLWHLFKRGDELYAPIRNKAVVGAVQPAGGTMKQPAQEVGEGRSQTVFICCQASGGRPYLTPEDDEDARAAPKAKTSPFWVRSFYIGYDGEEFGPIPHDVEISAFEGEKDITALEVYPLKYSRDSAKIKSHLIERGRRFKTFTSAKHQAYSGPTIIHHANGDLVIVPSGSHAPKRHAHIKGRVIVDFDTAISSRQWGVLIHRVPTNFTTSWKTIDEDYPINIWRDNDQKQLERTLDEIIFDDDFIEKESTLDYSSKDSFLSKYTERKKDDKDNVAELTDRELMLLPNTIYAYVLRNREFVILDIEGLRDVKPDREGLDSLKLPRGHKRMVQALVSTHFREKSLQKDSEEEDPEVDFVQGKGKGLIFLLHGAPGVGKTSTAECIAESSGKPLFPITCGDLGITAEEVEKSLDDKFNLAQRWDCVLLLDEADVFLAQRTKTDLKRNTLVSVFLRVLEYYTGILFLTTNRVGAFDEAFKSRIHISLYYPPLEEEQTKSIWKMNLDRTLNRKKGILEADENELLAYATSHYRTSFAKKAAWNGRQIRNAFQTAAALAEFEAHEKHLKASKDDQASNLKPIARLETRHFDIVAEATLQFDLYIAETVGRSDAERAYQMMERADQFRWTARSRAAAAENRPAANSVYPDSYRPPQEFYYTPQSDHEASRRPGQPRHHQGQAQRGETPTPLTPMSGGYPLPPGSYGMPEPAFKRERHAQYGAPWPQEAGPPGMRSSQSQLPQQDPRYVSGDGTGNEDEDGW